MSKAPRSKLPWLRMTISENSVFRSPHLEGELIGFFPGLMQGGPKAPTLMNGSTEAADVGPGFRGKLLPLGDSNPSSGSSLPTFYRKGYLRWLDVRTPALREQRIAESLVLLTAEQQSPK